MSFRYFKIKPREVAESLGLALLLLLVLYAFFWQVKVEGDSMRPGLETGDRVVVSRALAFFHQIKRGDIVICVIPVNGKPETAIKRVIALPGDALTLANGSVYINGSPVPEPYTVGATGPDISVTLGPGQYFVMGDNRRVSYDSRAAGPIPRGGIVARVLFEFFPKLKGL